MLNPLLEHAEFLAEQLKGFVGGCVIGLRSGPCGVIHQTGHDPLFVYRKGVSGSLCGLTLYYNTLCLDLYNTL